VAALILNNSPVMIQASERVENAAYSEASHILK
jgi:hypothetical protein